MDVLFGEWDVTSFSRLFSNQGQIRCAYDTAITAAALIFVALFCRFFLNQNTPLGVLGLCWSLPLTNLFLGVYGPQDIFGLKIHIPFYYRFRGIESWRYYILIASLLLNTGIAYELTQSSAFALLWAAVIFGPFILPRYFLHLNSSRHRSFASVAVRTRGPVLVVGGAGYIGTHVVEQLLKNNFKVRVLDKLLYGRDPICGFERNPAFEMVEGDATDILALTTAMNGASAVVHLAGLVGDPACSVDAEFTRHTNVIATRMVKEIAKSFDILRFVFASSCSVYGVSDQEVDEFSLLNPVSLYARTKIDSENELLLEDVNGMAVTVLRFATVFGHSRRPRFDLVGNLFTAQAYRDGLINLAGPDQWRPFIHVRDLARAVVKTIQAPARKVSGKIFNVGDARLNCTIGQLAETVQKQVTQIRPVSIRLQTDFKDTRNYRVSFQKIATELGFSAEVSLEEGIAEIVSEFKKGSYGDFSSPIYSNLHIAKNAVTDFYTPETSARLYAPRGEDLRGQRSVITN